MDNRPIGVFDSGVGGLTVVKEIIDVLPNEDIVYFGDTARVPYGSKSKETVTKFSKQIIKFLLKKDVKAIVIACGTVSSNSLDELVRDFDIPILGVVDPGAKMASITTDNKKVGVIGTEATIRSGTYDKLIKKYDSSIEVYTKACPLFVPIVEEGCTHDHIAKLIVEKYLEDICKKDIDTLVLGCTHYPLLIDTISEYTRVSIVNPAKYAAIEIRDILNIRDSLCGAKTPNYSFFVSDNTDKFDSIRSLVLEDIENKADKVDLEG